ncbi:Fibrinogen C domain-containing protein 1 [Branchiostoma belcheri]|nr:Fibrinogen C domain-containing protein 1 [Branchiostoma belcheri]
MSSKKQYPNGEAALEGSRRGRHGNCWINGIVLALSGTASVVSFVSLLFMVWEITKIREQQTAFMTEIRDQQTAFQTDLQKEVQSLKDQVVLMQLKQDKEAKNKGLAWSTDEGWRRDHSATFWKSSEVHHRAKRNSEANTVLILGKRSDFFECLSGPPAMDGGDGSQSTTSSPGLARQPQDCQDILDNDEPTPSGVYMVYPRDNLGGFPVFCDMDTAGGGWTLFQRRQDGTVDFDRGWADYKTGFPSNLNGEFWLGNDNLYRLAVQKVYQLRVDVEDVEGNTAYAAYDTFAISPEPQNYKLHIGAYSGTAGGGFTVKAQSSGWDELVAGNSTYIVSNGRKTKMDDAVEWWRGHQVFILNERTGEVVDDAAFDTYLEEGGGVEAAEQLITFLDGVAEGRIIAIVVHDSADALANLTQYGSTITATPLGYRESYAMITQKGLIPSWFVEKKSAMGAGPTIVEAYIPTDHSLTPLQGKPFSTKDRDNDESSSDCATEYRGGWWYGDCHTSNLNGLYHLSSNDGVNRQAWEVVHSTSLDYETGRPGFDSGSYPNKSDHAPRRCTLGKGTLHDFPHLTQPEQKDYRTRSYISPSDSIRNSLHKCYRRTTPYMTLSLSLKLMLLDALLETKTPSPSPQPEQNDSRTRSYISLSDSTIRLYKLVIPGMY